MSRVILAFEPPPARALDDTHYVLKNRQKFVELRGFYDDGTVYDPDFFDCEITEQPDHGNLYWVGAKTYLYVPNANSSGIDDTFSFECGSTALNTGTVTLKLVEHGFDEGEFVFPHGLTKPDFGIIEAAGAPDYYVNVETGVDGTGNPAWPSGSAQNPRLTIPECLDPGDVVQVAGNGQPGAPLEIEALGTVQDPVFIRGAGPLNRATLTQGVHIRGNYVIFEYIDFDASNEPQSPATTNWFQVTEQDDETGSSHVAIRHCAFFSHPSGQTTGVGAVVFGATHDSSPPSPNDPEVKVTDCVAYDILVQDFGDYTLGTGPDYFGAAGSANSEDTWILDSIFHHIQGSGAGVSRNNALSQQLAARRGFIGRNIIHHTREYAIQVKFGKDVIVSQNKLYHVRHALSTAAGGGVAVANNDHCNVDSNGTDDFYSDNVWVIFNEMYDLQTGVFANQQIHCGTGVCSSPQDPVYGDGRVYVVGNVFHHILPFGETGTGQAVYIGRQVQARVVNNTIYKCSQGVQIACTHDTGECPPGGDDSDEQGIRRNTSVAVINNIILDTVNDSTNDAHVRTCTGPNSQDEEQPATLTQGEFDYNLHYGNMDVRLPNGNFCLSVACLRNYYDEEHDMDYAENSVDNMAPNLEDPGELDFRATSASNFGDLGLPEDTAYGDFESVFPTFPPIYHDFLKAAYTNTECSFGAFADPDF